MNKDKNPGVPRPTPPMPKIPLPSELEPTKHTPIKPPTMPFPDVDKQKPGGK